MKVKIKNYRCFDHATPVEVEFRKGTVAIIGINNSGKSTILKFFYELRKLWEKAAELTTTVTLANISKPINIGYPDGIDPQSIFCSKNQHEIEISICIKHSELVHSDAKRFVSKIIFRAERYNPNNWLPKFLDVDDSEIQTRTAQRIVNNDDLFDFNPAATALRILASCIYLGTLRLPTGQNGGRCYDLQYGKDFIGLWDNWKNGTNVKQRNTISEVKRDIKSILNLNQLEISGSTNKQDLIVELEDQSLALTELGDGIGQCIITLATVAMKKPSFLLIDEPEVSLHASLQLNFIASLFSYTEHGVIFTTHSVGLARSAADLIKTVHLEKQTGQRNVKDFEALTNLTEFLGELNYSAYRDLGFEKILLVEGPSEIKVYQQFLRKYKLEHKIAILHGGGSALFRNDVESEIEEIKRISNNNLYVIIDSERTSENCVGDKNHNDFKRVCERMSIHCHLTERRATENYFTDSSIKNVIGEEYSALKPFEEFNRRWSKNLNWKIAKSMQLEDIQITDIGRFIEQHLR